MSKIYLGDLDYLYRIKGDFTIMKNVYKKDEELSNKFKKAINCIDEILDSVEVKEDE